MKLVFLLIAYNFVLVLGKEGVNEFEAKTEHHYETVGRDFIVRQRAMLRSFWHYQCPSYQDQDDMYLLTQTYNPLNNLDKYRYPDMVRALVTDIENGRILSKTDDSFTMRMCVSEQFQNLTKILEYSFEDDPDTFYKTLAYFYSRLNIEELFTSVASLVANFRSDGYLLPPVFRAYPQLFFPKAITFYANEMELRRAHKHPVTITVPQGLEWGHPEESIGYWKDDVLVNSFHFEWHQGFTYWYDAAQWDLKVNKSRQGELFLYVHHNLVARYLAERIALGLPPVDPIDLVGDDGPLIPIAPNILTFGLYEPAIRPPDLPHPTQVYNEHYGANITWDSIKQSYKNIKGAIDQGYFVDSNGNHINLRTENGTTLLGTTIEPGALEVNPNLYLNLHNFLHSIIAFVSDPDGNLGLEPSVLTFQESSMRDPMFYRIHRLVDSLYKLQLDYLPEHSNDELSFPGINITSFYVQTKHYNTTNQLFTHFKNLTSDITNSIIPVDKEKCSELPGARVKANIRQFNHKEFKYVLNVNSDADKRGVVRIFIAPAVTFGYQIPSTDDLRWSFIEMDRFPVELKSGTNKIKRSSMDTSLFDSGYENFQKYYWQVEEAYASGQSNMKVNKYNRWCGWPRSHYLPRGMDSDVGGMEYFLYAMISDYDQDFIIPIQEAKKLQSLSYCSVVTGPNPDTKPMGFPFDRKIDNWQQFLNRTNMAMIGVNIAHLNS